MVFVITLHLQTSVDAALSFKSGRLVTRGGHVGLLIINEGVAGKG